MNKTFGKLTFGPGESTFSEQYNSELWDRTKRFQAVLHFLRFSFGEHICITIQLNISENNLHDF